MYSQMFNYQIKVPVGRMPINLVLGLDESVTFIRDLAMPTIVDSPENGIGAVFTAKEFWLGDENISYEYNTPYPYKDIPDMLQWLAQQKLMMPEIN